MAALLIAFAIYVFATGDYKTWLDLATKSQP